MNRRKLATLRIIFALLMACPAGFTGCAAMNRRPETLLPNHHTFRTGPFRIHSHKPIKRSDPLVAEMESLTRSVTRAIGEPNRPANAQVDVYLLKDEESFRHYLKYFHPELPPRRAYFIATDTSRTIYTFMGEHLMEDLRHEATHALVNLSHPSLPLWLDEGLAESFEHPDRSGGRDMHIDKFLVDIQSGAVPDLARLEKLSDVRDMTPRDYRESWAWVQWGIKGPKPVRLAFDRYIRNSSKVGTSQHDGESLSQLWNEVAPQLDRQGTPMVAWLTQEADPSWAGIATAQLDPQLRKARLQNADPGKDSGQLPPQIQKSHPPEHRKKGFLRRLFGF